MNFHGARRPLTASGIVFLMLGLATLVAAAVSASGDGLGMTCSDGYGCRTENAVLFTLLSFGLRISMPLLVAGIVFLAGSQTLAALEVAPAPGTDAMSTHDQNPSATRHAVAARLWILAGILVLGSAALGLWSVSPVGQEVMMGPDVDRSSPGYILNQLSYVLVPAGTLAGFIVTGLALVVTRAKPSVQRPQHEPETHDRSVWDGTDHEPFKRPDPTSGPQLGGD
ncbi:hypothetical protein [Herbiconiux liukaitaii]|uniref:hypothetical protein n=1 Tax=Herbiconiux liukaitaii TaxID=3342799 RepID=UPI0035B87009